MNLKQKLLDYTRRIFDARTYCAYLRAFVAARTGHSLDIQTSLPWVAFANALGAVDGTGKDAFPTTFENVVVTVNEAIYYREAPAEPTACKVVPMSTEPK